MRKRIALRSPQRLWPDVLQPEAQPAVFGYPRDLPQPRGVDLQVRQVRMLVAHRHDPGRHPADPGALQALHKRRKGRHAVRESLIVLPEIHRNPGQRPGDILRLHVAQQVFQFAVGKPAEVSPIGVDRVEPVLRRQVHRFPLRRLDAERAAAQMQLHAVFLPTRDTAERSQCQKSAPIHYAFTSVTNPTLLPIN